MGRGDVGSAEYKLTGTKEVWRPSDLRQDDVYNKNANNVKLEVHRYLDTGVLCFTKVYGNARN